MKILVACEFSGIVRDAFIAEGHDAISCDLLPTERPGPHIQGDVRPLLREPWDLVIAHPPCTYLTHSRGKPGDDDDTIEAIEFFIDCLNANASKVAVENPMPFKFVRVAIGEPDYMVHPYQFGDMYLKKTYWWTKGLPPLLGNGVMGEDGPLLTSLVGGGNSKARNAIHGRKHRSPNLRSRFHPGMAAAMAWQWGNR